MVAIVACLRMAKVRATDAANSGALRCTSAQEAMPPSCRSTPTPTRRSPCGSIGRMTDGTFGSGRAGWLAGIDQVRNVVRQELVSRQLAAHLPDRPLRVLDIGAGQGTQSIRLARAGHVVRSVEPDEQMRT